MSDKEKVLEIINRLPEAKLQYVLAFLQSFESSDDIEDMLICEDIYQRYSADKDPEKHETMSLEDFAEEMGVTL